MIKFLTLLIFGLYGRQQTGDVSITVFILDGKVSRSENVDYMVRNK